MGDATRLAGVSVQTVSRVATGSDHMRLDAHAKVLRAMNKLDYSPSRAVQTLRRDSFKTIGVLTQQIQRIGEALITTGVLEAATAADYTVNLVQVERPVSDDLRQAVYRLSHQAIDSLVVMQAERADHEHLVLPPSVPVAVSDSTLVDHYPFASAGQVGGVRNAVEHPLGLEHYNIQHVYGPGDFQSSLIRRATWARCLREAELSVPKPVPGDWEAAAGYAAGRLLAVDPEVTAVFCANDELTLGLIQAIREQDRRVPGNVSTVGFDGFDVGKYSFPPLTAVRRDFRRHGREVVGLMLKQVASGVHDGSQSIIIPTKLVLWGSTAPLLVTWRTSTVGRHIPKLVEPGRDGRVVRVGVIPSTNWLSRATMEEWSVLGSFLLQAS